LCSDDVALTSGQMQLSSHIRVCEGNMIPCRTLICVRTDATLNCSNLLDTYRCLDACLGHPDGILGFDFSELESAQNLLWTSWTTFLKWRLWNKRHPWLCSNITLVILSNRMQPTQTNKAKHKHKFIDHKDKPSYISVYHP